MTIPPIPPDDGADTPAYAPTNTPQVEALLRTLPTTPDLAGWVHQFLQAWGERPYTRLAGRPPAWAPGFTVAPAPERATVLVAFRTPDAPAVGTLATQLHRYQARLEWAGLACGWYFPEDGTTALLVHRPTPLLADAAALSLAPEREGH